VPHKQHSPYGRLVAASILGPALLFAATAAWSWHRENREARSDINRTTQLLEEHAARMFQLDKLLMDRARDRIAPLSWPDVAAQESELHDFLQGMVSAVPEVHSVFVVDASGEPEVSSMTYPVPVRLYPPPTTSNLANRAYFQDAQAGAQLAIGGPYIGHISRHTVFTLAEPLTGPDGVFRGLVALNISPAAVTGFWQPLMQRGDIVALVKADSTVLARFPEAAPRSDGKPVQFSPAALAAFRKADNGFYEVPASPIDGRSRLIGYRRIPGTPVFVTYGMDRANLLREWYPTVAAFGGLALAASLALVLSSLAVIRRGRAEARAHWQAEQVAEALRESEARQRALYDRTPVPMQSADPEGRLLAVSERWLELLGYTREEVLGRPFVDFLAPASVPAFQAGWQQMLTFGEVRDVERQLRRKDGVVVDVLISARLERDTAGRFVRTAAVLIDVTEKKRIEHALQQAQKMEAIGQMTGGVAHDFNNLLMVVMGSLERLLERADQPQAVRRLAGTAMRAVERGANLTAQLLAYSRRQMLHPEIVNPNRLIREFARLIDQAAGERVAVQYVLSPVLDPARIDPAQFQTAILNLVVNPRRHARWRPYHDRDTKPSGRRGGGFTGTLFRRLHSGLRCGYRLLDRQADTREGVRAVLHHQGGWERFGPRAFHGLWLREAVGRICRDRFRTADRHDGEAPAPQIHDAGNAGRGTAAGRDRGCRQRHGSGRGG
jgi:PAS domain S-box-containing protein